MVLVLGLDKRNMKTNEHCKTRPNILTRPVSIISSQTLALYQKQMNRITAELNDKKVNEQMTDFNFSVQCRLIHLVFRFWLSL